MFPIEEKWQEQKFIKEGDGNTAFFHRIASNRKSKNLIRCMDISGGRVPNNLDEMLEQIFYYQKDLFGNAGNRWTGS